LEEGVLEIAMTPVLAFDLGDAGDVASPEGMGSAHEEKQDDDAEETRGLLREGHVGSLDKAELACNCHTIALGGGAAIKTGIP